MEANVLTKEEQQVSSIWQNKKFLSLWGAVVFSAFGLHLFMFSQTWYVVQVLNLEASIGLIFIASSIPRLLFMLVGGVLADRMSKSKIMFYSDLTRAILVGGLVVFLLFGQVSLWTFVMFALIFGILDAFFWPASTALLPGIVKKENLTRANSIIQMTQQSSIIIGPMIAGVVIKFGTYPMVFGTTAVLLVIASLLIYSVKSPKKELVGEIANSNMFSSIKEGFSYVKKSSFLTALLMTAVFLNLFIVGPMQMGLPLFVKNNLQGDTLSYSYIEGSLGVGMLAGSLIIGILNPTKNRGKFLTFSIITMGIVFSILSFTTNIWQSVGIVFIMGATFSLVNIPVIAIVQSIVDEDMIGRIMSLLTTASMGLIPVSYAITSAVLAAGMEIHHIILSGGLLLGCFAVFVFIKVPVLRQYQ